HAEAAVEAPKTQGCPQLFDAGGASLRTSDDGELALEPVWIELRLVDDEAALNVAGGEKSLGQRGQSFARFLARLLVGLADEDKATDRDVRRTKRSTSLAGARAKGFDVVDGVAQRLDDALDESVAAARDAPDRGRVPSADVDRRMWLLNRLGAEDDVLVLMKA